MSELLDSFQDLFTEPQGLPSERHLCHRIRLEHGVSAVAVRPYRYATPTSRKMSWSASATRCYSKA